MTTLGNITGNGLSSTATTTNISSTNVSINDPLLKLGKGNTGSTVDLGWYGEQDTSTTATYSGIFKDADDSNKFKIFRALQTEPTTTVNTGGTGYTPATLVLGALDLRNPANTFSYLITSAAIAADRTLNLPLLTATDTFAVLDFAQTFTNKTATGATNTLTAKLLRSSASEIDISAATAPTTGQVLTATSSTTATWQTPSATTGQVAIIYDRKTNGSSGGTFTSGAWRTRDLNTLTGNTSPAVTLSSNQFTIPSGSWVISCIAPALAVDKHQTRIQNITDTTTESYGTNSSTGANAYSTVSTVVAYINIGSSKTYELQHRGQTTRNTDGFGIANSFVGSGSFETYAQVVITKL